MGPVESLMKMLTQGNPFCNIQTSDSKSLKTSKEFEKSFSNVMICIIKTVLWATGDQGPNDAK